MKLFVKSLGEGQNHGFDLSLRKYFIMSLLACRIHELMLKVD